MIIEVDAFRKIVVVIVQVFFVEMNAFDAINYELNLKKKRQRDIYLTKTIVEYFK